MSIADIKTKIKSISEDTKRSLFITLVIVAVAFSSFAVGRISANREEGVDILYPEEVVERAARMVNEVYVVASTKGSVYYYPWCPNSLKEENLIRFNTKEEAESRGYRLASNCQGV